MTEDRMVTIYVLRDPRYAEDVDAIRYVGQTARPLNERLAHHMKDARRASAQPWHRVNWLRELTGAGLRPVIAAERVVPLAEANLAEQLAIAKYGQRGCRLTNNRPGGEVTAAQYASRERMWKNPEYRAKTTAAISATCKTPDGHDRKVSAGKAIWRSQEYRERRATGQRAAYIAHPEIHDKISQAQKRAWQDPEQRAKRLAGLCRPGVLSAAAKALWDDPVRRAALLSSRRAAAERRRGACQPPSELEIG